MKPAHKQFTRCVLPITVAIAGISTTASALDDGQFFYFGLNTGTSFIHNSTSSEVEPFISPNSFIRQDSEQRGFNGGAFIGFNFFTCNRFLLGLELSGLYYSNRGHATFDQVDLVNFGSGPLFNANWELNWDLEYSLSATLRPGYLINDSTLLYFQAGATYGWFNADLHNRNSPNDNTFPAEFDDNEGEWGATIGVGLQKQLTDCLSIFGAYQYTYYGKIQLTDGGEGIPELNDLGPEFFITNREAKLTENSFKFGVIFTF